MLKRKRIFLSSSLFISCLTSASTLTQSTFDIEQQISGSIGVSVIDTHSYKQWDYNGNDQFPMMSTFKTLACAKMLKDAEMGQLDLSVSTTIESNKLMLWSPITQELVGKPISVEKACEATMLTSDNTAANIVLDHVGGPQGITSFLRFIGDYVTRLDRFEPELNQALLGDERDTTTPIAMNKTLQRILYQNVLGNASQKQLKGWMQGNVVSDALLRSILPQGWSIADRSGAGQNGSRGITAIIWKEQRSPIFISIYLTNTKLSMAERNSVINEIGMHIFEEYSVK
ncbi:class A beta-lactamase [Vibrio sp. CyArs1]|uniref:class A beta-lactamase n=1 Tax=Vibrio sp. CyArs1 TaxID=2682577 RepID=UPI001F06A09F|nr:class A beta-lactamase [Vibrio sp. CyArs1]